METIPYPTRGGQSSYANQDGAIALARDRNARLIFLYVSNVQFLERLGHIKHSEVVENELEDMGEFLLAMACERAEKADFKAESIVRSGPFVSAMRDVIVENAVDTIVLGAPGQTHAVTTTDYLQNLIRELKEEYKVEIIVIRDGDMIDL